MYVCMYICMYVCINQILKTTVQYRYQMCYTVPLLCYILTTTITFVACNHVYKALLIQGLRSTQSKNRRASYIRACIL